MARSNGQVEIEVKFDLDPRVTAPDLSGLVAVPGVGEVRPGGTVRLSAVYHDTPGLDLLRLRTGGRMRAGTSSSRPGVRGAGLARTRDPLRGQCVGRTCR